MPGVHQLQLNNSNSFSVVCYHLLFVQAEIIDTEYLIQPIILLHRLLYLAYINLNEKEREKGKNEEDQSTKKQKNFCENNSFLPSKYTTSHCIHH